MASSFEFREMQARIAVLERKVAELKKQLVGLLDAPKTAGPKKSEKSKKEAK